MKRIRRIPVGRRISVCLEFHFDFRRIFSLPVALHFDHPRRLELVSCRGGLSELSRIVQMRMDRRSQSMILLLVILVHLCSLHHSYSHAIKLSSPHTATKKADSSIVDSGVVQLNTFGRRLLRRRDLRSFVSSSDNIPPLIAGAQEIAVEASAPPASSLAAINLLMLLFYGTLGAVMPYLPVFYSKLGVSASLIGVLGAITPAVTFLVSPLWGALADTTGWHKEILLLTFVGSIITRSALVLCKGEVLSLSLVVALSAVLNAPVKPLLDSAVMSLLTDKAAYGKSRLFGQVGMGLGSFLVAPLLQRSHKLLFVAQAALALPTALLMMRFQPQREALKKEKGVPLMTALRSTLRDSKVLVFFLLVFLIGVSSGIIENFAYVRLHALQEGVQGGGEVLGMLRLCSSLAGGPMFWVSGRVVELLGVQGVLNLSLLSYVLRFVTYATVTSAWMALPAELLRGVSFALFWAGATYHVYSIAPRGLTATMLGFLNGMYGGLGQSLGSLLGGELSRRYGIVKAFLYCGATEALLLAAFVFYQRVSHFQSPLSDPASRNVTKASGKDHSDR